MSMRTASPRASRRLPIDEAVTPLPSEEHTPPVTKISFFMEGHYRPPAPEGQAPRHVEAMKRPLLTNLSKEKKRIREYDEKIGIKRRHRR